ncbi:CadC family transcriptional regulator, partial [Klebsiella pneumoniae]|nr:CadC family transcriptional regulator [Klebsiella pneumoniae]
RETFFQEVWIKHGSQVTSNGFYQNISLLRRAFKELGAEEDIIITVPRVGVRLDATLSVTEIQSTEAENPSVAEVEDSAVAQGKPEEVAAA